MIVFFDLESTITKTEGLDEIAKWKGIGDEVAELTELGMSGGGSFEELLLKRLSLILPSRMDFDRLSKEYVKSALVGLENVLYQLRARKYRLGLISGGFIHAMGDFLKVYKFDSDLVFANSINFNKKGEYMNLPADQPLIKDDGKRRIMEMVKINNPKEKIVFVGDSVRDLDAKGVADILFIGFGGFVERKIVKEKAEKYLNDMNDLIFLLEDNN